MAGLLQLDDELYKQLYFGYIILALCFPMKKPRTMRGHWRGMGGYSEFPQNLIYECLQRFNSSAPPGML